jgi:hypothetical protein
MKRATFVVFLIPIMILAATLAGPLEQIASADPGVRGGHVGGGGRGGGGFARRGDFGGRGGHFRGGGGGGHFRGGIWFGPGWGLWDPFFPFYGYPYYPYYPSYAPPTVVAPQQPEYIQPVPQPEETSYWYYCRDPKGYYPYVKRCPGGWMKVVPTPPPSDQATPPDQTILQDETTPTDQDQDDE